MMERVDGVSSAVAYAFDFSHVQVVTNISIGWRVPAIWAKATRGVLTVSKGFVYESFHADTVVTVAEFLRVSRGRGAAEAKWDGTYFWAPNVAWHDMVKLQAELDGVRATLPNLPVGFDGWYGISKN